MEPGLAARSRLAARPRYVHGTPRGHWAKGSDRVSRQPRGMLRRPNSAWGLRLRQNRVSHLRVHPAQEARHLARGDRRGRRPRPGRMHVVPVVRPGHRPVPASPTPTARGMALLLTGGRPAGPLPGSDPWVGTEEGLTEGAPAAPESSGHRSPPRWKATPYPMRRAPAQDGCGEVGGTEPSWASREGEPPDERSLTVTTAVVVKGDDVEGVAAMTREFFTYNKKRGGRGRRIPP